MATFVNLDTVFRGATGNALPAAWCDQVNDNCNALFGDTAMITASLQNSWTVFSSQTVAYAKAGNLVAVRGAVTGGTLNTTAFTLPVGYRPALPLEFSTAANSAFGYFNITQAGLVTPLVGSTTWFSLACMFSIL